MPRIEEYPDAPALSGSEYVPISVLINGQYVTRRTTTQAIANKAPTGGTGGGGAADPYDGIRSWLSPYNVSAAGAPADNAAGINSAIAAAISSTGGSGRVLLPQGRININSSIILRSGVNLIGQGSAAVNGTELYLVSGSNCHVVRDSHWTDHLDYFDWGGISNLRINGNRAGNPRGSQSATTMGCGIAIYAMGEECRIQNVNIRECDWYGIYIPGPSLCGSGRNITTVGCQQGSLAITGGDGAYVWDNMRAELGGPLFVGTNCEQASVALNGCRQDNCGANGVVHLYGWRGCVIVNGGVFRAASKTVNYLVNVASLPTTGPLGYVAFPSPVYQQNFVGHLKHVTGGYLNVEFDPLIASGGWTTTMWYPGTAMFIRSGMRFGSNEGGNGAMQYLLSEPGLDTGPGGNVLNGTVSGIGIRPNMILQSTYDRYTKTTTWAWVAG